MPSTLLASAAVGAASINQPMGEGVQHHRAVELPLAGGLLGEIGDPHWLGADAGEVVVDQVGGDLAGHDNGGPLDGYHTD